VYMDREYMLQFTKQTRKKWLKRSELEAMTSDPSVLDMIKAGDAEKAGQLWRKHLQKAEEFVLSGAELSTVVDLLE